ncbi:MAG: ABC transporter permease [Armatimonadetes bacterium]|nr:ABC transporter permease [Anaerolineae bacterium]
MMELTQTPTLDPMPRQAQNPLLRLLLSQESILLVLSLIAVIVLSSQNERFLTERNLKRELVLLFEVALMAMPMTFIIITGGIDLSVGSIFGLSAVVLGFTWQDAGLPLEVAILIALATGALAGLVNGLGIVRLKVPPLIMTLATLALYRGMALGISEARSARGFPDWFTDFGRGSLQAELLGGAFIIDLPWQILIMGIVIVFTGIVLALTTFGRTLYAMGYNEVAARFAGLAVDRTKLVIYAYSGLMAAVAAVVFTSRVTTTRSDMGTGYELDVIAAVVLGGTSILGGSGTIFGTVLGLILIQMLKNGLLLAGVKGDATIVMIGVILIFAILVNNFIERFRRV